MKRVRKVHDDLAMLMFHLLLNKRAHTGLLLQTEAEAWYRKSQKLAVKLTQTQEEEEKHRKLIRRMQEKPENHRKTTNALLGQLEDSEQILKCCIDQLIEYSAQWKETASSFFQRNSELTERCLKTENKLAESTNQYIQSKRATEELADQVQRLRYQMQFHYPQKEAGGAAVAVEEGQDKDILVRLGKVDSLQGRLANAQKLHSHRMARGGPPTGGPPSGLARVMLAGGDMGGTTPHPPAKMNTTASGKSYSLKDTLNYSLTDRSSGGRSSGRKSPMSGAQTARAMVSHPSPYSRKVGLI